MEFLNLSGGNRESLRGNGGRDFIGSRSWAQEGTRAPKNLLAALTTARLIRRRRSLGVRRGPTGGGACGRGGAWRFVCSTLPPPAPRVPVTRLHRAAAGRIHPAAAVPGCSKGEVGGGEQRTESPERRQVRSERWRDGEAGAVPGVCGGRVCVSGGGEVWGAGLRASA